MIFLKSLLAGFVAIVVACFLLMVLVVIGLIAYQPRHSEAGAVGWDPISLVHANPWLWLISLLISVTAFIWEYRRAVR